MFSKLSFLSLPHWNYSESDTGLVFVLHKTFVPGICAVTHRLLLKAKILYWFPSPFELCLEATWVCTWAPAATSTVFLPLGSFLILRANSIPAPEGPGLTPKPVPSNVCCLQLPSPCPEWSEQVSPTSVLCCGCRALAQALTHTCTSVTGISRTLADHTRTGKCCLKVTRVVHMWPAEFGLKYYTLVCTPCHGKLLS